MTKLPMMPSATSGSEAVSVQSVSLPTGTPHKGSFNHAKPNGGIATANGMKRDKVLALESYEGPTFVGSDLMFRVLLAFLCTSSSREMGVQDDLDAVCWGAQIFQDTSTRKGALNLNWNPHIVPGTFRNSVVLEDLGGGCR